MKKLVLLLFVACVTLSANAQFYVGGSTVLWYNGDTEMTTFSLLPEVGYVMNDKWSFGTEIGFEHGSVLVDDFGFATAMKANSVIVGPYARFTYFKKGMVGLFVDGGLDYAFTKIKDGNSSHGVQLGLKPGIALGLNDRLSLVAKFGFVGFRHDYMPGGEFYSGGGFGFTGNDLSLGFYVSF